MKRFSIIPLAVLAFTPLHSATAQVRPGARVRVTGHFCQPFYSNCVGGSPRQHVGTFLAWKADSLVMESDGDTLAVPLDSVTTLEVRPVERSIGKAVGGLLAGALIGAIVGAVVGLDKETSVERGVRDCDAFVNIGCTEPFERTKSRMVVSPEAVAIGAAAGGLLGLLIGVAIAADRWVAVSPGRLGLNVGPQRDGRFGFGASVRF